MWLLGSKFLKKNIAILRGNPIDLRGVLTQFYDCCKALDIDSLEFQVRVALEFQDRLQVRAPF